MKFAFLRYALAVKCQCIIAGYSGLKKEKDTVDYTLGCFVIAWINFMRTVLAYRMNWQMLTLFLKCQSLQF